MTVRFIWINQPYEDNWSWRQSDVAAIARNFYTNGFHFAHPQIDWAGDQPGYVGTEFPILPFWAAALYKVFGVHEWIGRTQAVLFFAISLPLFFCLVRDVFSENSATWALFFYAFAPLSIFTSREFMPDFPSLSLSVIGLYCFLRWTAPIRDSRMATLPPLDENSGKMSALLGSAVCISLSILVKLPSAIIGAPLACLAFQSFGSGAVRDYRLWIFAVVALLPAGIWYFHAYEVSLSFYPHHFFGAGGIRLMNARWYWKILWQIVSSSLTFPLSILTLTGLVVARSFRRANFFYWWLLAMVVFIIVVGYGHRHQWYQLPLVAIAAAFAGVTCESLSRHISSRVTRTLLTVVLATTFCASAFIKVRPLYQSHVSRALRQLGLALKSSTPPRSLIVAADNGDPTVFYYAERTGWHFLEKDGIFESEPLTSAQAIEDLKRLRRRGATYLAFTWATVWWLDYYKEFAQHLKMSASLVESTPEFRIYRLND